jgi:hypothetical protein
MVNPAIKEVSFLPLQVEKFAGGESKERQGKRDATWESGIWEGTSFLKCDPKLCFLLRAVSTFKGPNIRAAKHR